MCFIWMYSVYTFTYQKTLLHTLLLLVFKIVESLQCILKKIRFSVWLKYFPKVNKYAIHMSEKPRQSSQRSFYQTFGSPARGVVNWYFLLNLNIFFPLCCALDFYWCQQKYRNILKKVFGNRSIWKKSN